MIGIVGNAALIIAFISSLAALVLYFFSANNQNKNLEQIANFLFVVKGSLVFVSIVLLVYLIFTHQFQYYYVYNYTSKDLQNIYLFAAFYSGQEGSFLLWIFSAFLVGLAVIKWTPETYRTPVMTFFSLSQVFLLSMVVGLPLVLFDLGASPFRLLADEMADAPVFQSNPDFIPADGSGLNDLLRNPWIMIHPPVVFLGFAMMTIPFAFALSALWKRRYHEWIYPALPWTLGANLCLLISIFLGGYWAYETLSFGGYWAWDPVENASLVPWILGTAGLHTMLIQRKSAMAQKSSILFAILAYITIVYQTFLTRSGVLEDASVHSFVDLGLYNQLLMFILVTTIVGVGMFLYRYKELPTPGKEAPFISREFIMFSGAFVMFMTGFVILLGTSTPIIGRILVENPTPPEQEFYNTWTLPFAVLLAIMTVVAQFLWWKKHDAESLSSALITPTLLASVTTIIAIILVDIDNLAYMVYLFAAIFALFGNGQVMIGLIRRNSKVIGGTVTHIGFAILLIGFLGAAYDRPLVDDQTAQYNQAVLAGEVMDDDGYPVSRTIDFVELKKGEPKLIDGRYKVTYKDAVVTSENRPHEQHYTIKFEDTKGNEGTFYMNPVSYPMLSNSSPGNIDWTVDPEIRTGLLSDIFMYVAGSSLAEREIERLNQQTAQQSGGQSQGEELDEITDLGPQGEQEEEDQSHVNIGVGSELEYGNFTIKFDHFINVTPEDLPENAIVGVRANLEFIHNDTGDTYTVTPLFAIVEEDGDQYGYSPPEHIEDWDAHVEFANVDPGSEQIELNIEGIEAGDIAMPDEEWVLLAAERKPLISIVWLGTFLLMIGFSISIFRRWSDQKKREAREAELGESLGFEEDNRGEVEEYGGYFNGSADHADSENSEKEETDSRIETK